MALLQAKVDGGILEGLPAANQMFSVFRGVPFAAPPVGELRWKDPQPVEPWEGVRPCYKFGPLAMQEPLSLIHIYRTKEMMSPVSVIPRCHNRDQTF